MSARSGCESAEVQRRLRVLVVEDDRLVRRRIREQLDFANIQVAGEAQNDHNALRAARDYKPDVILLEVVLPGADRITLLEQLVADDHIGGKVVVLSLGEGDVGYLALRKGAAGYLNKERDLSELPRVVRDVAGGGVAISGTLTADLARRLRELPEIPTGMRPVKSALTTREWEVLDQLCLGLSTPDIAEALALSRETVRVHVKNLMRKLKVHSRREAVEAAQRLRAGESLPMVGARARESARHAIPFLAAAKG